MKYSLRSLMRFSIRDMLWLMVVVGLIAVVVRDRWLVKNAPLALDGFCAVTLVHSQQWQIGDPKCQTIHEGQRYLFASTAEKELFLSDPRRYVPVCGGNDAVRLADDNLSSPGKRRYGLSYKERIYLFDSEDTLRKFEERPSKYVQRREGSKFQTDALPTSGICAFGLTSSPSSPSQPSWRGRSPQALRWYGRGSSFGFRGR